MPRSRPVALKIAAIAVAGVNATDCMPDATAPCVPAHDSSSRSSTRRPQHAPHRVVGQRHLGDDRLPVPAALEVAVRDGFLSPPMFASRIARSGLPAARAPCT